MTGKDYQRIIKFLKKELEHEERARKWYERMYNLAIGEVGQWRTLEGLKANIKN